MKVSSLLSDPPAPIARRLGRRQLRTIQELALFKTSQRHDLALRQQRSLGRGTVGLEDEDPDLRKCLAKGRELPGTIRNLGSGKGTHTMKLRRRLTAQTLDSVVVETTGNIAEGRRSAPEGSEEGNDDQALIEETGDTDS